MTRQANGDCGEVTIYGGIVGLGYYMGDPAPLAPRFYGNVMFVPSGDQQQTWPGTSNDATTTPFTYVNPEEVTTGCSFRIGARTLPMARRLV